MRDMEKKEDLEDGNYDELIKKREGAKINFVKTQMEKNLYLGEFKENVVAALTIDQLLEDPVYDDVLAAIASKEVKIVKMRRDVELKKLKPYIVEAEKQGIRYQLVDGLSYKGDIALVVVTEKTLDNKEDNLVIKDIDDEFIEAGLGEILSKHKGEKVCKNCYNKIAEKLPKYKDEYEKAGLLDTIFGFKCPNAKNHK